MYGNPLAISDLWWFRATSGGGHHTSIFVHVALRREIIMTFVDSLFLVANGLGFLLSVPVAVTAPASFRHFGNRLKRGNKAFRKLLGKLFGAGVDWGHGLDMP